MTIRSSCGPASSGVIDRRTFLGGVSLAAAGSVVATSFVPLSSVYALTGDVPMTVGDASGFGHVDDMCGHWPPYSHPIPYGRLAAAQPMTATIEPIDQFFLI